MGNTTIVVEPLGVADLKRMSIRIMAVAGVIGPDVDFDTPGGMAVLFTTVMENAPDLLELACGLHRDDIARLPIAKGVELLRVVLEVNIGSKESLVKNCVALAGAIKKVGLAKAQTETAAEAGE